MEEDLRFIINNESLAVLLRSNLSCHLGKVITQESLGEITHQIIESLEFFLNKKDALEEI